MKTYVTLAYIDLIVGNLENGRAFTLEHVRNNAESDALSTDNPTDFAIINEAMRLVESEALSGGRLLDSAVMAYNRLKEELDGEV